jgi:hypothetical protein
MKIGDVVEYTFSVRSNNDPIFYGEVIDIVPETESHYIRWQCNGRESFGYYSRAEIRKADINMTHLRLINKNGNFVKDLTTSWLS